MGSNLIFKLIAGAFLALIALYVVMHMLSWMVVFVYTAATVLVTLAVGYGLFLLLKNASDESPKIVKNYKLTSGASQVYVFRSEPELRDIVHLHDELHVTKLELAGDVIPVPKDSQVIVLEDSGKESVKIRVKADKRKNDIVGWVDRSNLVTEMKSLN